MGTPDKEKLMDELAEYGYVLVRPKSVRSGEDLLKNLLKQNDARLLEGFPVVFANLLQENEALRWEDKKWKPGDEFSKKEEQRLSVLLVLSYFLFQLFGLEKEYGPRTHKLLRRCRGRAEGLLKQMGEPFQKSEPVKMDEVELSTERLKNNFRNYVVLAKKSEEGRENRRALEFELLLSELFTTRQKELMNKVGQNKPLTKTEREYFYRVVKKRLRALADERVHELARDLVYH